MGCIFILKDHLCQAEIRVFGGRRNLTSPAKQYENRAIQDQGSGDEDAYSVVDKSFTLATKRFHVLTQALGRR